MPYSYKNQYPIDKLPERIRLSNGLTRTDSSSFTTDELADAGYVEVSTAPTYDDKTHQLNWNGSGWEVVELTASQIEINTEQEWVRIRTERDHRINSFDWRVERYHSQVRLGSSPTTDKIADLDSYIQALRDITKQSDPYNITWPNYEDIVRPDSEDSEDSVSEPS